jgi:hypothetical protein
MNTKAMIAGGRYARVARPAEIRDELALLSKLDQRQEGRTKILKIVAIASGIVGFLTIFVLGGIGFIGLLAAAVFGFFAWRGSRFDIPNGRYETLLKLSKLLGADLPPQGTLDVAMDLRRSDEKAHLDSEFEKDRWKVKLYINDCLRVSGRLADGNKFWVVVTERQEERSRWARTRSGKSKLKRKTKSSLKFDVTVRPDVERYGQASALDKLLKEAAKVPAPMTIVQAEASDTELRLRAAGPGHPGLPVYGSAAETVAMLLLSAYQCLNFQAASLRGQKGAST